MQYGSPRTIPRLMQRLQISIAALLFAAFLFVAGCGGGEDDDSQATSANAGATTESGLTPEQLENGIGPISNVDLGEIDDDLAEEGEEIFETKCSACHKLDARYVGPELGTVLDRRTPEYVMNMILNPEEMVQKHPDAREMLTQFLTPMPNQQLTEDDARAVLEYLREEAGDEDHD